MRATTVVSPPDGVSALSDVREALCRGPLGGPSEAAWCRALRSGARVDVPAGALLACDAAQERHVALVLDGVFRVFVTAASGRQATLRYARPGDLVGLASALGRRAAAEVQAVRTGALWVVTADALERAARTDPALAWALAVTCADLALHLIDEAAGLTFLSVRQRVARHLLDLAGDGPPAAPRTTVHQQALADAVGSVREVVVRVLREFRAAGLVRSDRGGLALLDVPRLHAIAAGEPDAGTSAPGTSVPCARDLHR